MKELDHFFFSSTRWFTPPFYSERQTQIFYMNKKRKSYTSRKPPLLDKIKMSVYLPHIGQIQVCFYCNKSEKKLEIQISLQFFRKSIIESMYKILSERYLSIFSSNRIKEDRRLTDGTKENDPSSSITNTCSYLNLLTPTENH